MHPATESERDVRLLEALLDWRRKTAAKFEVPVFYILQEKTVKNIVERKPLTLEGLLYIDGIAEVKLSYFGPELLEIVEMYLSPMERALKDYASTVPVQSCCHLCNLSDSVMCPGCGVVHRNPHANWSTTNSLLHQIKPGVAAESSNQGDDMKRRKTTEMTADFVTKFREQLHCPLNAVKKQKEAVKKEEDEQRLDEKSVEKQNAFFKKLAEETVIKSDPDSQAVSSKAPLRTQEKLKEATTSSAETGARNSTPADANAKPPKKPSELKDGPGKKPEQRVKEKAVKKPAMQSKQKAVKKPVPAKNTPLKASRTSGLDATKAVPKVQRKPPAKAPKGHTSKRASSSKTGSGAKEVSPKKTSPVKRSQPSKKGDSEPSRKRLKTTHEPLNTTLFPDSSVHLDKNFWDMASKVKKRAREALKKQDPSAKMPKQAKKPQIPSWIGQNQPPSSTERSVNEAALFEAPPDLDTCAIPTLRRFLMQNGYKFPADLIDAAELRAMAKNSLPSWEVQRVLQCEKLPTERRHRAILRLEPTDGIEVMKSHFRKLSLIIHPDKNCLPDASHAFYLLQSALHQLSTQLRRP